MIGFPNAKINIGLHIISKRKDGFHNIETIFYPVECHDILEFIKSKSKNTIVSFSGIEMEGNPKENIVYKAWEIMHQQYGIPYLDIHLHKNIPIGAGLGGGSSDAAKLVTMINEEFALGLQDLEMEKLVSEIGSDCAFFVTNKPAFAHERGNALEQIHLELDNYTIELFNPRIHISTQEAYSGILPSLPAISLKEAIKEDISCWKDLIFNDFEKNIFERHPEIESAKNEMYNNGAVYASMSGSGSTVYGIYQK